MISNSAWSLPKNAFALFITPLYTQLAPDGSSAYGGSATSGVQAASRSVAGLPSVSASRIAVVGRQTPQRCFSAQQLIRLSAPDMLVMAWNRACSLIDSPFEAATWRMAPYRLGAGCGAVQYASKVCAAVRVALLSAPTAFTSLNSVVYWALVS